MKKTPVSMTTFLINDVAMCIFLYFIKLLDVQALWPIMLLVQYKQRNWEKVHISNVYPDMISRTPGKLIGLSVN